MGPVEQSAPSAAATWSACRSSASRSGFTTGARCMGGIGTRGTTTRSNRLASGDGFCVCVILPPKGGIHRNLVGHRNLVASAFRPKIALRRQRPRVLLVRPLEILDPAVGEVPHPR